MERKNCFKQKEISQILIGLFEPEQEVTVRQLLVQLDCVNNCSQNEKIKEAVEEIKNKYSLWRLKGVIILKFRKNGKSSSILTK